MRKFIDRVVHGLRDDTYKWYAFLKESQSWSRAELGSFQLCLFDALWKDVIVNVPYYKDVAKKIGLYSISSKHDIEKIPFLTKEIVRENFESLQSLNVPRSRFMSGATSGSSGKNFFFYNDAAKSPLSHALLMRRYDFMGVNFLDREIHIWGSHFERKSFWTRLIGGVKSYLRNDVVISGYNLSEKDMYGICDRIKKFRPKIIHSYPSILCVLADFIKRNNIIICGVEVVYIGGEKLYDFQKKKIESVFDARVFDFYGACDMGNMGMSCCASDKIHIFQENVFFEVVNEFGGCVRDGQGDIVVTDLHDFAMPFIRYKIGDMARVSASSFSDFGTRCTCGCNLQQVDEILGRSFEIVTMPNGNRVCGTFWTLLLKSSGGIKDFQVVQRRIDKITIFYTLEKDKNEADVVERVDFEYFRKQIHKYSGNDMEIDFVLMDVIPVSKSGKKKFIISEIN